MPYLHYEKASAQATVRGYMNQTADSQNRQIMFNRRPTSKEILLPQILRSRNKSPKDDTEHQNQIEDTAEGQSDMEEYGDFIFSSLIDPPEQYLIGGYLNKEPPLHVRKSLDEFHCIGALDALIGELDMDQIVYKHSEKKLQRDDKSDAETLVSSRETVEESSQSTPKEHPIIVVDQLWLWIIDSGQNPFSVARAVTQLIANRHYRYYYHQFSSSMRTLTKWDIRQDRAEIEWV
jgi:hypothetical protein